MVCARATLSSARRAARQGWRRVIIARGIARIAYGTRQTTPRHINKTLAAAARIVGVSGYRAIK